jgi:hypothetical protein
MGFAGRLSRPRAVTFDCWATLLYEVNAGEGAVRRARLFAEGRKRLEWGPCG